MHNWLEDNKANPDDMDGHAVSHLGWGVNSNARWDNIALCGDDDPSYHSGAARVFAGNFPALHGAQYPRWREAQYQGPL
jgi:2,5-dihydroxypyridine 5,6-dioxygenase